MKTFKKIGVLLLMLLSFFTTVLCMKDTLQAKEELQAEQNAR